MIQAYFLLTLQISKKERENENEIKVNKSPQQPNWEKGGNVSECVKFIEASNTMDGTNERAATKLYYYYFLAERRRREKEILIVQYKRTHWTTLLSQPIGKDEIYNVWCHGSRIVFNGCFWLIKLRNEKIRLMDGFGW